MVGLFLSYFLGLFLLAGVLIFLLVFGYHVCLLLAVVCSFCYTAALLRQSAKETTSQSMMQHDANISDTCPNGYSKIDGKTQDVFAEHEMQCIMGVLIAEMKNHTRLDKFGLSRGTTICGIQMYIKYICVYVFVCVYVTVYVCVCDCVCVFILVFFIHTHVYVYW